MACLACARRANILSMPPPDMAPEKSYKHPSFPQTYLSLGYYKLFLLFLLQPKKADTLLGSMSGHYPRRG